MISTDVTGRGQCFTGWTSVDVLLLVEREVGSAERAVIACALIPDRDVWRDFLADDPGKELPRSIGRVCGKALRLYAECLLRALKHWPGCRDLVVGACRGGLNVNDDSAGPEIDQVIEPVAELHALVGLRRPGRTWVHRRDHLWRLAIGIGVFIIETCKELLGCTRLMFRQRPVDLIGRFAVIAAGVGLDDAGINSEAFALNKTRVHASPHHRLEYLPEYVAIAEPPVTIDRERRVVRHLVIKTKTAEPSISEVQRNLLAQSPLEADAIAVANNQHPEHEFRINRGPTNVAVEGREVIAQISQNLRHDRIDTAQQVARRNASLKIE